MFRLNLVAHKTFENVTVQKIGAPANVNHVPSERYMKFLYDFVCYLTLFESFQMVHEKIFHAKILSVALIFYKLPL